MNFAICHEWSVLFATHVRRTMFMLLMLPNSSWQWLSCVFIWTVACIRTFRLLPHRKSAHHTLSQRKRQIIWPIEVSLYKRNSHVYLATACQDHSLISEWYSGSLTLWLTYEVIMNSMILIDKRCWNAYSFILERSGDRSGESMYVKIKHKRMKEHYVILVQNRMKQQHVACDQFTHFLLDGPLYNRTLAKGSQRRRCKIPDTRRLTRRMIRFSGDRRRKIP